MVRTLIQGQSPCLVEVLRVAEIVAVTDVNVLITGETGTGKELLARTIHQASPRYQQPFVSLNCASLEEDLADSLLFGHCRGAFTDAKRDHDGYVHQAADGTLFLDEVADLPLTTQAKLLRFLESGEYQPLGCGFQRHSTARVLAATNRCLDSAVAAGTFRRDLYYRLNVIPLHLPPLRERRSDIELLAVKFLSSLAQHHGLRCPGLSPNAVQCLQKYDWPGNVRELRNLCERLLILLQGQDVQVENLPPVIRNQHDQKTASAGAGFVLPVNGIDLYQLEQDLIRQALASSSGNQSQAARLLGLTRDTLLYRIKKYGIQDR
ncbi:ATPase AAA [Achromatium sp. WMS2]|nr:ATPase AAA [Achromatium sp. WMS2]